MANMSSSKRNWLKWLLFGVILTVLLGGAAFWYVMNVTFDDTSSQKPAYTIAAMDMLREFQETDSAANKKYAEQIVVVTGRVTDTEAADTTVNIKFVDSLSGSYLIFDFQSSAVQQAKTIRPGDSIAIKASCSGSIYSQLRKAYMISFKRSVIDHIY